MVFGVRVSRTLTKCQTAASSPSIALNGAVAASPADLRPEATKVNWTPSRLDLGDIISKVQRHFLSNSTDTTVEKDLFLQFGTEYFIISNCII